MGCFRACFSLSKSRKLGKSAIKSSLRDRIKTPAEAIHPANFEPKSRAELEKYASLDIPSKFAVNSSSPAQPVELENAQELLATTAKKRVTSDLVIKENASDHIQKTSATIDAAASETKTQDEVENETDLGIPFKQNAPQQEQSSGEKKATFDPAITADEAESTADIDDRDRAENKGEKNRGEKDEKGEENEAAVQNLLVSKALLYPAGQRYGNCNTNYEENEDMEFEQNNFDEEDDQIEAVISSESSGSLFTLSIDFDRQGCVHENEVNSGLKMSDFPDLEVEAMEMDSTNQNDQLSSCCVDSVLNPVENLAQWTEAEEITAQPFGHHQNKENISLEREYYKSRERNSKHGIAVDTSLSSWLVESENTPKSKSSDNSNGNYSLLERGSWERSFEERPILGALTMEDIKQFSASPSPIQSRSRIPVETPIIGTVGSYWTHTQEELKQLSSSPTPIRSRSWSPVETPIIGTVGNYWSYTDLSSSNSARIFREENTRRQKTPFAARLEKALEENLAEV